MTPFPPASTIMPMTTARSWWVDALDAYKPGAVGDLGFAT